MTARRRPSLVALALSLALLLLLEASVDAASPFWRPSRSLFGEEGKAAAPAAPAPSYPPLPPSPPPPPTTTPTAPPAAPTALCAEDGPEGCGALVIQPPAAKAALKDYVDCVTDPAAAGEACVREGGNGSGNGNGAGGAGGAGASSLSPSSSSAAAVAKAESDPRDACPDDPLFDDRGEFSAGDWGAVAD